MKVKIFQNLKDKTTTENILDKHYLNNYLRIFENVKNPYRYS